MDEEPAKHPPPALDYERPTELSVIHAGGRGLFSHLSLGCLALVILCVVGINVCERAGLRFRDGPIYALFILELLGVAFGLIGLLYPGKKHTAAVTALMIHGLLAAAVMLLVIYKQSPR